MKNIELGYLFVAYSMAGIMFYATRHQKFPTLSHIALGTKVARQAFFWGLLGAGLLFLLLMHAWFVPHFALGRGFILLALVLVGSQALTGFFPVEHDHLGKFHVLFSSIMAACMLLLLSNLAFTQTIDNNVRIINALLVICMLFTLAITPLTTKRSKQFVVHEFIFFSLWHFAILVTTYFG